MKLMKGLCKFMKGSSVKTNPKILIIYGNYGGAGFSARRTFDKKNNQLYQLDNNNDFVYQQEMNLQDYHNYYLSMMQEIDVIDELDACFKLHDLDTNSRNIKNIIKASHYLPLNMSRIDPIFYLSYPLVFSIGVIYFATIGRPSKIDESDIDNINQYRIECQNIYRDRYNIKYV
ncbi:hypothetical protein [Acanthamoeba polyphaga mimivirus]|uniref:Uncharacterized protein n=6 Tax=Megamimivirinae TaxID=3044648 RepID=A0A2L2DIQ3_MIMIV|nr:hypothetical protein MegaChil _gp0312 [Megavirus chiliensis]AEX61415.1 hypothetical protein c7_R349 [Megavirus courdo7]AFX92347.1 hypothetical protein CE11_00317 [Megavirus courdo11]AGD92218.1 hypothetical protein LBA_00298 [Megavirus lba]AVG46042.1 hypothetical protein [Acanthamoeba polyphaga mimivirus]AEQ32624.1 hypothetical protein [Megavirus chiliensis]